MFRNNCMIGMFSCHASIARFLSRQSILSTFSGKVSPVASAAWAGPWRGAAEESGVGPRRSDAVPARWPKERSP